MKRFLARSAKASLAAMAFSAFIHPAFAQSAGVIRDAEIEETLKEITEPLARIAGSPEVNPVILGDTSINAFVKDGKSVYLNSGLITKLNSPSQLRGVIAHELGHIAGGHAARAGEAYANALIQTLLTTAAFGAAGLAAGGGGGAAAAGLLAGQQAGSVAFTSYTQTQERAADRAGLNFLNAGEYSSKGVLETLEKLNALERGTQSSYLRTHPLPRQRLEALEKDALASPYFDKPDSPELIHKYKRAAAKIIGFTEDPDRTISLYPLSDQDEPARIARAVAYHKSGKPNESAAETDALIKNNPDDPFLHELQGQLRFERGDMEGAITSYGKAFELAKDRYPLISVSYAQALSASEKFDNQQEAIRILKKALLREQNLPLAYRIMATAYDRTGESGKAALAAAQYAMLIGDRETARRQAERALKTLPPNSPEKYQAKDVLFFSKRP